MTEEVTTEDKDSAGSAHSGGSVWVIALVLLIALLAAIWFFTRQSGAGFAEDSELAEADGPIDGASEAVENAAEKAEEQLEGQ